MAQGNLFEPQISTVAQRIDWGQLTGSSLSLLLSNVLTHTDNAAVVITPDTLTATRLFHALEFYLGKQTHLPILNFPDWETLPYDTFSPHQDIISQRLLSLFHLPDLKHGLLILPITTLLQRLPPRSYVQAHSFDLKKGQRLDIAEMRRNLEFSGYRCVAQVVEHGEYATRGSIIDLFPMGVNEPYRIDLLDDEIDSIRNFDPETQRSLDEIMHLHLLPAREFPLDEENIARFRQNWRNQFAGNPRNCIMYQDISNGVVPSGIEYYLPLFFEQTQTIFDYLPAQSLLFILGDLSVPINIFWQEIKERYEQRRHDITRPLLEPTQLYISPEQIFTTLKSYIRIHLHEAVITNKMQALNFDTLPLPNLTIDNKAEKPLVKLQEFIQQHPHRILFCAETTGRREILLELLKAINLYPARCDSWQDFLQSNERINITVALLEQGLFIQDPSIVIISEAQLFGQQVMQRRRRKQRSGEADSIIRNLAELRVGMPVVHFEHGVGKYLGLQVLQVGEYETEFLALQYADNDKLYVPVSSLHLISRYSGADPEHAPLHRLGTEQWQKARRKAAQKAHDVAAELLDIYARRNTREGFKFNAPDEQYYNFAAQFPFEETPDQLQAIDKVIADMTSGKPMDRLICGDVGFGKTEVAIRAAFLSVQSGKQVAILVPTTLLAQQHFQNFQDRFADWPIKVEMISRFRNQKQQTDVIRQVKEGNVDILIGTHKILNPEISFKNLGLVIIDEEHRFGVRQKERFKALRAEVDILTLTATPIPRTLNMSLSGLRELSIIATPPAKRLSIKTFVHQREDILIREAILREIMRGGQVYFVHNSVDTIERTATELTKLIPEARINIGHGQMRERDLERIMSDFYHQRFNVLVCTTIIENGIDIPSANTIIIDHADRFGLAQLHQLRGRVGRSHHQAYAYLMLPQEKSITKDAEKRLEAIMSLEDLGVGFILATHDLEIRGAGELLGEDQSGQIHEVGFSLYMELLDDAIKQIKSGKTYDFDKPLNYGTEIDLQISALIPADYLPDINARLTLYKRIANAPNKDALHELQVEMIDRFGLLTPQIDHLFVITELKLLAQQLSIRKIKASATGGTIEFYAQTNLDPVKLIKLIQDYPQRYKMAGENSLRFYIKMNTSEEKFTTINKILMDLTLCKMVDGVTEEYAKQSTN